MFCRLWSQPIRDTHTRVGFYGTLLCVVGLTRRQLPLCLWGGGRSRQGTCGWLFFLGKTLTSSLPSGFCDFYLLSNANIMMNIPDCCWKEEIRACQSLPSSELKLFCVSPEVWKIEIIRMSYVLGVHCVALRLCNSKVCLMFSFQFCFS